MPHDDARAAAITAWLTSRDTRALSAEALWTELSERLVSLGTPLWRAVTSLPTKHPEVFVRDLEWQIEQGCGVIVRDHAIVGLPMFSESPVAEIVLHHARTIRCRLVGPGADLRYPVCRELAAQGATDYIVIAILFGEGVPSFASWTTKAEGGFGEADIATFEALREVLTLRLELEAARYTTRCLLEVYLGQNAAQRVLRGEFKRGSGGSIRAAIWFCDMRGFTALADRAPADEVVRTLDRFFERVAGPIALHGGEILKFIGDAVLAIFPIEDDAASVCASALAAAEEALVAVDALNGERAPAAAIGLGIALHVGEVMYGNIGARERLDFTVIGAAVNEVTRVEAMCKTLDARLLMTSAFAHAWGGDRKTSLGHHALRGVSEPAELFTIR